MAVVVFEALAVWGLGFGLTLLSLAACLLEEG